MDPALPKGKKEATRFERKASEALRGLLPYARRHSSSFLMGLTTAVCVVAARLALPWPLRKVTDQWMITPGQSSDVVLSLLPPNWDLALMMGLIFLLLLLMLGYFDYRERLYFARFASGMVREMRSDLLRVASHISQEERTLPPGDLATRLLGDSARVRSGLQGFLVHVATSGLVFCGVTLILLGMSSPLGLIFAAAGIGMAILTTWGAARTFKKSLKNRKKEGKLANHIDEVLALGSSSGTMERSS
jgi:ABC-type multidrug transport system fused ATPase/permease subunit